MTALPPTDSFPNGGFFVTWPDQRFFANRDAYEALWGAAFE